ncbi:MAG: hypothetical protein H0V66_14715 [Bdellovibrionales bacterium]|nr:hypothetical protein [Bdellovibrionales bacterium]
MFDFLGKDPRTLFLEFSPAGSNWQVVSWNFDLQNPNTRQWTLEVHKPEKESIQWTRDEVETVQFYKNNKLVRKRRIPADKKEFQELMNLCIHSTLKQSLERNHEFLRSPVSGANAMDYQNEARALQWLQASFGTLIRALDQFQTRKDLILTAAVFSGTEPGTGHNVLRIVAFNLDVFCYFLEDLSLNIAVFDDKNLGQGGAKTPSFQQIIKVTKPQIYDEIVKLVHRLATVGEIR